MAACVGKGFKMFPILIKTNQSLVARACIYMPFGRLGKSSHKVCISTVLAKCIVFFVENKNALSLRGNPKITVSGLEDAVYGRTDIYAIFGFVGKSCKLFGGFVEAVKPFFVCLPKVFSFRLRKAIIQSCFPASFCFAGRNDKCGNFCHRSSSAHHLCRTT